MVAAAALLRLTALIAAPGRKLRCRERNPAEHLAGILGAARRITAFLGRDAVVQNRNHQLCIPFQPNDGKLPQRYKQPAPIPGEHQFLIKHLPDIGRDLDRGSLLAVAVTDIPHLGAEHHGIQHLHHRRGSVEALAAQAV